jgi:hypothetical protein
MGLQQVDQRYIVLMGSHAGWHTQCSELRDHQATRVKAQSKKSAQMLR